MPAKKCSACKGNSEVAYCKQCYKVGNVVKNELLMYVSSYRSKSTSLQLKQAVLNFYSHDDVELARKTLIDNVRKLIPEYPHLDTKRTNSVNRQARDIMADDIIDIFRALESLEDKTLVPKFLAADHSKLPSCGPEAAGSLMNMYENLASQQRQLLDLQNTVLSLRKDVD